MKYTIVGRKCTPKDSFKERAEVKLGKIDRLFGGEGTAKITASVNKNKATVELTVNNSGMFFRSQATSDDMSDALDAAIDSMIRQIRKNKTKVAKKVKTGTIDELIPLSPDEEETDFNVVRYKTMNIKPQSIDEAILQMNMLGHSFYMFENQESGEINVVYARKNGGYGVLEPNAE